MPPASDRPQPPQSAARGVSCLVARSTTLSRSGNRAPDIAPLTKPESAENDTGCCTFACLPLSRDHGTDRHPHARPLAAAGRNRGADRNEPGALGALAAAGVRCGRRLGACADGRPRPPAGESVGAPYIAFEDGPLRSVRPGPSQPPMSMVMDRSGIYYRAASGSDLDLARRRPGLVHSRDREPGAARGRDAAAAEALEIQFRAGALAAGIGTGARSAGRAFWCSTRCTATPRSPARWPMPARSMQMLTAAMAEDPAAEVVVKLHPDVLSGRRAGYFSELKRRDAADARRRAGQSLVAAGRRRHASTRCRRGSASRRCWRASGW